MNREWRRFSLNNKQQKKGSKKLFRLSKWKKKRLFLAPLQNFQEGHFCLFWESSHFSNSLGLFSNWLCTEQTYDGFIVHKGYFGRDLTCVSNDLGPFVQDACYAFWIPQSLSDWTFKIGCFLLWVYKNCSLVNVVRLQRFSVDLILTRYTGTTTTTQLYLYLINWSLLGS